MLRAPALVYARTALNSPAKRSEQTAVLEGGASSMAFRDVCCSGIRAGQAWLGYLSNKSGLPKITEEETEALFNASGHVWLRVPASACMAWAHQKKGAANHLTADNASEKQVREVAKQAMTIVAVSTPGFHAEGSRAVLFVHTRSRCQMMRHAFHLLGAVKQEYKAGMTVYVPLKNEYDAEDHPVLFFLRCGFCVDPRALSETSLRVSHRNAKLVQLPCAHAPSALCLYYNSKSEFPVQLKTIRNASTRQIQISLDTKQIDDAQSHFHHTFANALMETAKWLHVERSKESAMLAEIEHAEWLQARANQASASGSVPDSHPSEGQAPDGQAPHGQAPDEEAQISARVRGKRRCPAAWSQVEGRHKMSKEEACAAAKQEALAEADAKEAARQEQADTTPYEDKLKATEFRVVTVSYPPQEMREFPPRCRFSYREVFFRWFEKAWRPVRSNHRPQAQWRVDATTAVQLMKTAPSMTVLNYVVVGDKSFKTMSELTRSQFVNRHPDDQKYTEYDPKCNYYDEVVFTLHSDPPFDKLPMGGPRLNAINGNRRGGRARWGDSEEDADEEDGEDDGEEAGEEADEDDGEEDGEEAGEEADGEEDGEEESGEEGGEEDGD